MGVHGRVCACMRAGAGARVRVRVRGCVRMCMRTHKTPPPQKVLDLVFAFQEKGFVLPDYFRNFNL